MALDRSDKPFPEALAALLEDREVSMRGLARITQDKYGWGSPTSVSAMLRGEFAPSVQALEHIAGALQVSPNYFAEYRLAQARFSFDPDEVGLRSALKNLAFLELAVDGGADAHAPRDLLRRARRGARAGRAASAGS